MTLARNTRLLGAATVVALTAGALGVVAPAAATSAPLAYTCAVLGQTRTFTMVADLDAPPTIAFGETIAANAIGTLTVPEDVTAAIRSDLAATAGRRQGRRQRRRQRHLAPVDAGVPGDRRARGRSDDAGRRRHRRQLRGDQGGHDVRRRAPATSPRS